MSLLQTEGCMLRSCSLHAQTKGKPDFLKVACFRLPGSDKPSERWTGVMEAAQKGVIAKLRILSMDVVMATNDGSDRCLLSLPSLQPSMPCAIRKQPLGGAQSNLPDWTMVQAATGTPAQVLSSGNITGLALARREPVGSGKTQ